MNMDKNNMNTQLEEDIIKGEGNVSKLSNSKHGVAMTTTRRLGMRTLIPILFIVMIMIFGMVAGYALAPTPKGASNELKGTMSVNFGSDAIFSDFNLFIDKDLQKCYANCYSSELLSSSTPSLSASTKDTYKLFLTSDGAGTSSAYLELKLTFYNTTRVGFAGVALFGVAVPLSMAFHLQEGASQFTCTGVDTSTGNTVITLRTDNAVESDNYMFLDSVFANLRLSEYVADIGFKVEVTPYNDSGFNNAFLPSRIWGNLNGDKVTYSLTLNENGGVYNGISEPTAYDFGSAFSLPDASQLTKTGYTLDGWCENYDLSDTSVWAIPASSGGAKTFYAKWTAKTATVTLNSNGATNNPTTSVTATNGEVMPTIAILPTKTGYEFGGYYDGENGAGTQYYANTGTSVRNCDKVGNFTLYAKWTAKTTTIILNIHGATNNPTASVTATYDAAMPAIGNVPERAGYMFGGYYDGEDGVGTQYYTNTGTSVINWNKTDAIFTLHAKWTVSGYTVTLNNGTGVANTTVTATYDAAMPAIGNVPERAGYTFGGYYDGEDGTGVQYYYADGTSVRNCDKVGDFTLYAKWTAMGYTVTLNNGTGATPVSASVTATYGEVMPTIAILPTKTGYEFGGYYDGEDGTGVQYYYADGTSVRNCDKVGDFTLYAKWVTPSSVIVLRFTNSEKANDAEIGWGGFQPVISKSNNKVTIESCPGYIYWVLGGAANQGISAAAAPYLTNVDLTHYTCETIYLKSFADCSGLTSITIPETITSIHDGAFSDCTSLKDVYIDSSTIASGLSSGTGLLDYIVPVYGGLYIKSNISIESLSSDIKTKFNTSTATYITVDIGGTTYNKWVLDPNCTVTLNSNDATNNPTPSVTATYGAAMPSIEPLPTKTGYTFGGYYDGANGTGVQYYYADGTSVRNCDKVGDFTLYAKWTVNTYTITYYLNDGENHANNPLSYTYGAAITLNAPNKAGYTFDGWTANSGACNASTNPYVTIISSGSTGNKTLYAKWTAMGYTVTLNNGTGATPESTSVRATYGMQMPSITTLPTKDGALFDGYYENNDYTGTRYYYADGHSAHIWDKTDTNATIYAKWVNSSRTYSVQHYFEQLDGLFTMDTAKNQSLTGTYGSTVIANYLNGGDLTEGYEPDINNENNIISGKIEQSGEQLVLKLYYKLKTYTITFIVDTNKATVSGATSQTLKHGATAVTVPNVTAETGYTFNGWNPSTIVTPVVGNAMYIAQFTANTYTVTYVENGGADIGDASYTYGVGLTLPTNLTKTGYTFAGWRNNEGLTGNAVTAINATDSGNKIFYAKWTTNTNTAYIVRHNQQNIGDDGYTLLETEDKAGATGATTEAVAKAYTGFTVVSGWTQSTIMADGSTIVNINYNRNIYDITFNVDTNKATVSGATSQSLRYGATVVTAPTVTAETGYTFTGWNPSTIVTPVAANATYTAQFTKNTYTVTYVENGGTDLADASYTYGTSLTLPTSANISKTGYTFAGWYVNAEFTSTAVTAITATDSGNKIFYAKWIANTNTAYQVKHYKQNIDGTFPSTASETEDKAGVTGATTEAVAKAYTGFTAVTPQSQATIKADGSTVVNIYYNRNVYTITFIVDTNKATVSGALTSQSLKHGATVTAPTVTAKTGYTFTGWSPSTIVTPAAANATYTANITANTSTVTLNNGTGALPSSGTVNNVTYGSAMPTPITLPTKTGYTFGGYYDGEDGTGTQYYTNTGASVRNWDKVGDTTLHAKWMKVSTLVYHAYVGDATLTDNYTEGVAKTLRTDPIGTNPGHIFVGWTAGSGAVSAGNPIVTEIPTTATGTQSVYEQWGEAPSQMSFTLTSVNSTFDVKLNVSGITDAANNSPIVTVGGSSIGRNASSDATYSLYNIPANATSVTITSQVGYNDWYPEGSSLTSFVGETINKKVTSVNLSSYKGTQIGQYAFYGCTGLTSITIPSTVTTIGESAFQNCSGLTSIMISQGVTTIGNSAFQSARLESITIPESVTTIGPNAFYTPFLTRATFNDPNDWYVGPLGDETTLVPATTLSVPADAATALTTTYWYRSWVKIALSQMSFELSGASAFTLKLNISALSNSIANAPIVNNVGGTGIISPTQSGNYAQYSIPAGATLVTIASQVGYDGWYPEGASNTSSFVGTSTYSSRITSVDLTLFKGPQIGQYAFAGCTGLTSITIPSSVTTIGASTFYNCTGLTSITIPSSVTTIGASTFYNCTSLTSITIPSSVTTIGASTFYNCTGLTSITISSGVNSIGDSAFYGCAGLTSITIPSTVTTIGVSAFSGCTGLTSITIPSTVTTIGVSAFSGCTGLTSITLPFLGSSISAPIILGKLFNSSATISNQSSYVSTSLRTVTINGGTIDDNAFRGCTGLIRITLSDGVTSIGASAFYNCTNLRSITIPEGVTTIGNNAFQSCTNLRSITIPEGVTTIGNNAFQSCTNLRSITISSSVISIGYRAFYSCSVLMEATFVDPDYWFYGANLGSENTAITDNLSVPADAATALRSTYVNGYWAKKAPSQITFTLTNSPTFVCYINISSMPNFISLTYEEKLSLFPTVRVVGGDGLSSFGLGGSYLDYIIGAGATSVTLISKGGYEDWWLEGGNSTSSFAGKATTNVTSVDLSLFKGTSIGQYAFAGCTGLTSITIPSSVTTINDNAFTGCTGLTSLYIDSATIASGLSSTTVYGNLIANIGTGEYVYINKNITTINSYITTNFTLDSAASTSTYKAYRK